MTDGVRAASQLCGSLATSFSTPRPQMTPLNEVREGVRQYWADWDGEGKFGNAVSLGAGLLARFVSDGG